MFMNEAESIIKTLNLQKHPEGGYFRETYRSDGLIPENILNNYLIDIS